MIYSDGQRRRDVGGRGGQRVRRRSAGTHGGGRGRGRRGPRIDWAAAFAARARVGKALGQTQDEGADKRLLTQHCSDIAMAADPSVLATTIDRFRAKKDRGRAGKGKDKVRAMIKTGPEFENARTALADKGARRFGSAPTGALERGVGVPS